MTSAGSRGRRRKRRRRKAWRLLEREKRVHEIWDWDLRSG
jgi:hypothetical protein